MLTPSPTKQDRYPKPKSSIPSAGICFASPNSFHQLPSSTHVSPQKPIRKSSTSARPKALSEPLRHSRGEAQARAQAKPQAQGSKQHSSHTKRHDGAPSNCRKRKMMSSDPSKVRSVRFVQRKHKDGLYINSLRQINNRNTA
ncbi:hypothetical protein CFIMG_003652RA [Ceratocystis fimbriata CBS 114723]|uniref:Uncharacterized protein n=1 Tax=Ceratocystis fimbriata CBS 114723 TaxID=1035309 RepID=A0A2C5X280_9PEZI|nr:hypothetical protein CFIMG_003652RA [Ceratocystis fimbriata CBS 114723]